VPGTFIKHIRMDIMNKHIKQLIMYAINKEILDPNDQVYAINKIINLLNIKHYEDIEVKYKSVEEPSSIISPILDYAVKENIIIIDTVLNRDIFEAKIMDALLHRPSTIIRSFNDLLKEDSEKATN
jgi:UDPglucose--hexose-1-phosphate uridylyltransferase